MMSHDSIDRFTMAQYCSELGNDPLLVQGAGGNVSWKDGQTLWIKRSGAWLQEANTTNIFVAVDLMHLYQAFNQGDFSIKPQLLEHSEYKPSIETLLHALLPHKIVVHIHAIEILSHLVKKECKHNLFNFLDESICWVLVDYYKPGDELAVVINQVLQKNPNVNVIFLKNHGVVIGEQSISKMKQTIFMLTQNLKIKPLPINPYITYPNIPISIKNRGYQRIDDIEIEQFVFNSDLFSRLTKDWALYPDHVVFLGSHAHVFQSWESLENFIAVNQHIPELVFIWKQGVLVNFSFDKAKMAQLRCYYDVLARQRTNDHLVSLSDQQVQQLLEWDAEHYRMNLAQKGA